MNKQARSIRKPHRGEFRETGRLMVQVYPQLDGFPKETDQPEHYRMLANIGELTGKPETKLLVAVSASIVMPRFRRSAARIRRGRFR